MKNTLTSLVLIIALCGVALGCDPGQTGTSPCVPPGQTGTSPTSTATTTILVAIVTTLIGK